MASALQPTLTSGWTGWTGTELQAYATTYFPGGCDPEATTGLTSCDTTLIGYYPYKVKHTNIPSGVSPLSTKTATNRDWDIAMVTIILPADSIPRSELESWSRFHIRPALTEPTTDDRWMIDHILTAPASCPTPFETTTSTPLHSWGDNLPSEFITEYLLPKATVVSAETYTRTNLYSPPITEVVRKIHVKSTDLPPTRHGGRPMYGNQLYNLDLDKLNQSYVQNCYLPDQPRPPTQAELCPYTYAGKCSKLESWMVIVAAIIPSIFVLGFVENFFWFRRLMLGKTCLRMGTVCWALILIFVVGFTIIEKRRSPEDRADFRQQWKTMQLKTKIKLWFQFGFSHRYPVTWLGERKKVVRQERVEMQRGGGFGGGNGGAASGGQPEHDDTPLPAYPGPRSSGISGTTVASSGPVLGNPNAVLGSGTAVIGPTLAPVQMLSSSSPQQPAANTGPASDGFELFRGSNVHYYTMST
ncbi:hypothetical protein QBC40DRAFT_290410 [Triangularia verruculosa]|uniref:Uncharacterized protein n=1 Tax=Triangularia verruculosa TaxID=2587418 RepID=A0AAN6XB73_9PEZI|nr:hypothetical protein QBC40DRAFT_290410 [Triangularia verruculosa]